MKRRLPEWLGLFLVPFFFLAPSVQGAGSWISPMALSDTFRVGAFESLSPADSGAPSAWSAEGALPADWVPLAFGGGRGETRYSSASVDGRSCLRAEADAGGSGLLRLLEAGQETFPRIRWSWWVENPVPGGDLTRKDGDDFAARIYVNFRFEPSRAGMMHRLRQRLAGSRFGGEAPGKALVYVWGNQEEAGTVAPNAYTDQAMIFVVRSGVEEAGKWWTEERDLFQDFEEAFGHPAPGLHSIAIMTDADDTGSAGVACYGDILLIPSTGGPAPPARKPPAG